ncbi:hypothetical protein [Schinkia azotoformans]|uniref:hypothetical protein n=1 Tax=Schinkia azotoformans TaxID=1454 RepID=UPI00068F82C8|nr:hypothetical protein [Schinkia azotoformans]MEC1698144.1 hypothetical protein [Schinkia azotoformans]MEC1714791.1 hypothetical protein [Schinkia azotoformans]MEC1727092.1 hypothetical protein [Schinkia azotoformans]MEC1742283.1 hypothetical protein [Schinkia azotoformans]MEC1757453.1 hypothetical protein [Schinkia azotoformans]
MSNVKNKIVKRKHAIQELNELVQKDSSLLLIHYSCESFYKINDGRTPRITSIAVRYYSTGQTKSFSIHKVAEKKGKLDKIEDHYNELEKEMLDEFFQFINSHNNYNWIHWNMRDINYGFEAINHRYSVLGGTPIPIHDKNKYDLARKIVDIYGNYIKGHPRFEKLIEKNNITKRDFLSGKEEAQAFDDKQFVKLHQSTLRKVDILHSIVERIIEDDLKTDSTKKEIYGLTPQGIYELLKENWGFNLIIFLVGAFISGVISVVIAFLLQ